MEEGGENGGREEGKKGGWGGRGIGEEDGNEKLEPGKMSRRG